MRSKSENFKEIIHSRMNEFLLGEGYPELINASPVQRGKALLHFYIEEIMKYNLYMDDDQIETAFVDGAHDLGIDFIYRDDNQIYIIQSKYIGSKSKLKLDAIDRLINIPQSIKNNEYIATANNELKGILKDISKLKNPIYNLIFLTTDLIPKEEFDKYLIQGNYKSVSLKIEDFSHLRHEYDRIQSLSEIADYEIDIDLGNEDFFELKELQKSADYPTIIFTQKGTKIADLYNKNKETLFNNNIRLWLGEKNQVNSSMIGTITTEPERFIYYNNGITAVCDWYEYDNKKLKCKNFQIINGAQTVSTLARQKVEYLLSLKVLCRLIVGESGKSINDSKGLNECIVKNTNSQSVIHPADFRSNDAIQISIEKEMGKLKYKGVPGFKYIFYKRKRRSEKQKDTKVITIHDVGKSFYAFKYNPIDLNASISKLWDISPSGFYYHVFGKDGDIVSAVTNERVVEYLSLYSIYEYIKQKVNNYDKKENPARLFKYHILWGIGIVLKMKYDDEQIYDILYSVAHQGRFVNPNVNSKSEEEFSEIFQRVFLRLNLCIIKKIHEKENVVMRNLQRSKEFLKEIEAELKYSIIPSKDIPNILDYC